MKQDEIDALFDFNMEVINMMNVGAGSMIKALVMAVSDPRNGPTHIRLKNPEEYRVEYEVLEGKSGRVAGVADLLGIQHGEGWLEVRH